MNKREFQNMMARRAKKKAAKAALVPVAPVVPERTWRQPTAVELGQVEARIERAKQDEDCAAECERMIKHIEELGGWHLHWRAGRLLDRVDGKPKRPNHPKDDKGKYIPMRKLLALPADPKRQVIDTKVGVVPNHVKSLPNKGNVPILKVVGYREVDHAPAMYMHSVWFGAVKPLDLLKWLTRFAKMVENQTLYRNILRMEGIYGTPRIIRDFRAGERVERLESKGAEKVGSQQIKHGPIKPRGHGAALHHAKMRDKANRQRIREAKGHRPFRQNLKVVHRAFNIEIYKESTP